MSRGVSALLMCALLLLFDGCPGLTFPPPPRTYDRKIRFVQGGEELKQLVIAIPKTQTKITISGMSYLPREMYGKQLNLRIDFELASELDSSRITVDPSKVRCRIGVREVARHGSEFGLRESSRPFEIYFSSYFYFARGEVYKDTITRQHDLSFPVEFLMESTIRIDSAAVSLDTIRAIVEWK